MCTSPAATAGSESSPASAVSRPSRSRSVPAAASSTASQRRPAKRSRSHSPFRCRRLGTRQPQDEAVFETLPDVVTREPILPFRRGPAAPCNEAGECRVPAAARGEADEFQAVRQRELAADDERKASLARSGMCPHDPRERAFIRQRERAIAEFFRARDQLRRMRRAAQEREVADAVQFRIRHRGSRPRESRQPRGRCAAGTPLARAGT